MWHTKALVQRLLWHFTMLRMQINVPDGNGQACQWLDATVASVAGTQACTAK